MRNLCPRCDGPLRAEPVDIEAIVKLVAKAGDSHPERIYGSRRDKQTVFLRHVAAFAAHEAGFSYPEIGAVLDRHHTSVMAGARRIARQIGDREDILEIVEQAKRVSRRSLREVV